MVFVMAFLARHLEPSLSMPATICLAVLLAGNVGCRRGVMYQARSLPPELVACRSSSLQNVDLSRLARSVGNSEVLYPGDVVEITIATGADEGAPLIAKVRVDEYGYVIMPPVGAVRVAGLAFNQAEQVMRAESIRRGQFVDPNISFILDSRRSNRVTVVGAVEKPGTYELPAIGSDVLAAIVRAEGLSEDAGTIIEVRHPPSVSTDGVGRQMPQPSAGTNGSMALASHVSSSPNVASAHTERIDLEQADVPNTPNLLLEDGATVMVMKKPTRFIHVIGLVRNANRFEMRNDQELRLLDAIAMAGGCSLGVADKIHIVRQVPNRADPALIETSIREAKRNGAANILLAAGDVVSVEETPVTLVVGTIRDFVRFGFSAGIPGL
jgi:polysaccharide export outer membrane protein